MCAVPRVLFHRWALFAHRTLTRVRQPWSTRALADSLPRRPGPLGSACYRRSTQRLAPTRGASTCAGHWPRHSCVFYAFRLRVVSRECFGGRLPFRPLPGSTSLFSVATDAPTGGGLLPGLAATPPTYPAMPQGPSFRSAWGRGFWPSSAFPHYAATRIGRLSRAGISAHTVYIARPSSLRCPPWVCEPASSPMGEKGVSACRTRLRRPLDRPDRVHASFMADWAFVTAEPFRDPSACPTASYSRHGLFDRGKDLLSDCQRSFRLRVTAMSMGAV